MIEHMVDPGSPEWRARRMGIATASAFDQVVTPAKCELSASARKYAFKLLCERLLRAPTDTLDGIDWVEHGKAMEPAAVKQYEFVGDVETRPSGFWTTDDGQIGATPDRVIIGKAAGLEIKSPSPWVHLGYLLDGPGAAYKPQVQGQLLVCEWEFVDFYSFQSRMPAALVRTQRDEPYIGKLRAALAGFNEMLAEMLAKAETLGVFQAYDQVVSAIDLERAEQLRNEIDPALREA